MSTILTKFFQDFHQARTIWKNNSITINYHYIYFFFLCFPSGTHHDDVAELKDKTVSSRNNNDKRKKKHFFAVCLQNFKLKGGFLLSKNAESQRHMALPISPTVKID